MSQLLIWCCFFSPSCHDNSSTAPFISSGPGLHRQPFGLLQNVQGSIGESLTPLFCAIVYLSFQQFALKKKSKLDCGGERNCVKILHFPPREAYSLHLLQPSGRRGSLTPRGLTRREAVRLEAFPKSPRSLLPGDADDAEVMFGRGSRHRRESGAVLLGAELDISSGRWHL